MKIKQLLALLITALVGLGLGACGEPAGREAEVNIRIQGLSTADNVLSVLLWAPDGGISYDFYIMGEAGATEASFVLDIVQGSSVVHTVEFSLPLSVVNAVEGDVGSGSATQTIYPDSLNDVSILFNWDGIDPNGETHITLSFQHPPQINEWSAAPGPGVAADTTISITADVDLFGTGGTVTAQFWDSSSYIGTAGPLSYTDPVWKGTVKAAFGATELHLIASDDEGVTTSAMAFPVTTP